MSSNQQQSSNDNLWLLLILFLVIGCGESGEDLLETAKAKAASISKAASDAASDAAGQVADDVKSLVASEGVSKVNLDKPYELGCHIRFLPVDPVRGSILQITSYANEEEAEKFPSFLIHANVSAAEFVDLHSKSLSARFFFKSNDKDVWYSPEGQDVSLVISKVGAINHELKIQTSSIIHANTGRIVGVTAEFSGALE